MKRLLAVLFSLAVMSAAAFAGSMSLLGVGSAPSAPPSKGYTEVRLISTKMTRHMRVSYVGANRDIAGSAAAQFSRRPDRMEIVGTCINCLPASAKHG